MIYYHDDLVTIYHGDCREILPSLQGISAVVTDPPYNLTSISKRFGNANARNTPSMNTPEGSVWARKAKGFMNKEWDGTGISFQAITWRLIREACLPGAMLLSFGGTRTSHRIACAIEDAGWQIRDTIMWVYGSGFPKSLSIGKSIDKQVGAKREQLITEHKDMFGKWDQPESHNAGLHGGSGNTVGRFTSLPENAPSSDGKVRDTLPATPEAKLWEGYGTGLKPSYEPILVCMKPLEEPALDIVQAVMLQLRHNGLEGEVRWKQELAISARKQRLSQSSTPTSQRKTAEVSAELASGKGMQSTENDTQSEYESKPVNGGLPTKNAILRLEKNQPENCGNKLSTPMGGNVLAAEKQQSNSLPLTILTKTGNSTAKKLGVPMSIETSAKGGSPQYTDCYAGIATAPSQDMANVHTSYNVQIDGKEWRIDQLEDGSLVWPDGLPRYRPARSLTFANNALKHKVAGLNIDKCRVGGEPHIVHGKESGKFQPTGGQTIKDYHEVKGRFPANFIHDGSQEVMELFPDSKAGGDIHNRPIRFMKGTRDWGKRTFEGFGDSGSAARFFYCAKSSRSERDAGLEDMELTDAPAHKLNKNFVGADGSLRTQNLPARNNHPTVKPLALMTYLCKLVKMPEYNLILDPFCGSGTTLLACKKLGIPSIGIDSNEEYCEIAAKRLK